MRVTFLASALAVALSLAASGPAYAQSPLTLPEALARAREQAPRIVASRLAIEEARGRLAGASVRQQSNPEVEFAVGNRQNPSGRSLDVDASLTQLLDPRGRRSARIDGATAAIDQQTALLSETTRLVLLDVASAFLRAVHANERLRLLEQASTLATRVLEISDRRYRAGDIAILDVNLARAALARVRADQAATRAAKAAATGELMVLLRLDSEPEVAGTLAVDVKASLAAPADIAATRPEIRELEAAVREAEAEVRLGNTYSRPDYGISFKYEREEQSNILFGGVRLTFPTFSKGQELRAVGGARANRLRHELESARLRVQLEVQSAIRVYERRLEAVRVLEQEALPSLDENDTLANRSFEVGQLGLPELLLIRREILDTRFQYLDAQLEAALARIDVDAKAGVLR